MEEGEGIQDHKMKVKNRKEYKRRTKLVLKSELNAKNKIAAINTLTVTVILYSYGVIDWKLDEIHNLKWKEKAMHGKIPNYLDKDHVDIELSFEWMKHTGLKGKTEGPIMAAQDQVLTTKYYSKHIIKQGTTDRCRMCYTQPETVEHKSYQGAKH